MGLDIDTKYEAMAGKEGREVLFFADAMNGYSPRPDEKFVLQSEWVNGQMAMVQNFYIVVYTKEGEAARYWVSPSTFIRWKTGRPSNAG